MAKKSAPTQYVAFLRGINLGNRRLKMDELRQLFVDLKFANVATFIASGNVIFETSTADVAKLETRIEEHLEKSLGYAVETFLRTPAELAAIVNHRPFAAKELDEHTLHVFFLRRALTDAEITKLAGFDSPTDAFQAHGREWYWLCRGRTTDSPVKWPLLNRTIGVANTARNVTTIRKLVAKYPAS
ncbi:MAG TPA: DUF1697 domain-containing protein [Gemmataceae bacterium]|jgi:uncharacterized protein (DUF1697 family)|nr:DUF1697 domain-containing protein [Gemmataceae bacterium]